MSEFGQTLLRSVGRDFSGKMKKDRKLKRLAKRIRDGTTYYEGANEYSVRTGELLSEALLDNTETLAFMSPELASEVLYPILTSDHQILSEIVDQVQTNMNEANDLGLSALLPELDTNRIDGLIQKISSYATFDEARYLLAEPIINFSQAVIDQGMMINAEASSRLGLRSVIRRKTAPSEVTRGMKHVRSKKGKVYDYPYSRYRDDYRFPCKFCQELDGTYDYDSLDDNTIFRRHLHCRCSLTFENGKSRQNVWWKQEWTDGDKKAQKRAYKEAEQSRQARDAIREEESRKRREILNKTEAQKEAERQTAMELMRKLNLDANGAYRLMERYDAQIKENGLDWLIRQQRRA